MDSRKVREFLRSHVLGLVAIFIALTGTAVAGQQASDGPDASVSVVTDRKFKKLKRRVAALEQKAPSPTGGANTVGSTNVINSSLGGADFKDTYIARSLGETVAANVDADQTASCGGDRLLSGGYTWTMNPGGVAMHINAPVGGEGAANPNSWNAQGSTSVGNNTLFAWAVCLPQ